MAANESNMNDTANPARRLLDPSELGTKEYWDEAYARELHNHADDGEDEGTIWFDENGAEEAVVKLLEGLAEDGLLQRDGEEASRFVDLGTGNGHMLFTLRGEGEEDDDDDDDEDQEAAWKGDMLGVDYSPASVQLATRIAQQRAISPEVRFEQWDLLSEPAAAQTWLGEGFDVVLDKGTFDAISLMPREDESAAHACEGYRDAVLPLLKVGGFLVLTSCNWTKEELMEWFCPKGESESGGLEFFREARYPTFTFGGQTGQSIVTIAFRRKADKS